MTTSVFDDMEDDDIKYPVDTSWSYLLGAIQKNDESMVRHLIEGVDLKKKAGNAVLSAANLGFAPLVALLLKNGAWFQLNQVNPFFAAARNGHVDVAKVLMAHGIGPLNVTWNGYTPLHTAAHFGHLEMVQFLLPFIPVDTLHPDNLTTAFMLAVKRGHLDVAEFLLENGCDLEFGSKGRSPFLKAVESNQLAMVRFLLKRKANPKKVCHIGTTAIYHAATKQNVDMLELVIPLASELMNLPTLSGFTPLHAAVLRNSVPAVKTLLKHGANLDQQSHSGSTALHYAFDRKNEEIVSLLIVAGARIGYGPVNLTPESQVFVRQVEDLNLQATLPNAFPYLKTLLLSGLAPYPRQWVSRMMPGPRTSLTRWVQGELHAEDACQATVLQSRGVEGTAVDELYRRLYDLEPVRELIAHFLVHPRKVRESLRDLISVLCPP
jgi:ankyrin repeat protein